MRLFIRFIALFIVQSSCFGLSQDDTLRKIWINTTLSDSIRFEAINQYYVKNTFSIPDSSRLLTHFHFKLAKSIDSKDQMARAYNEKAITYYIIGEVDSAMIFLQNAVNLRILMGDSLGIARLNVNIGNIYREKLNYQQAVKYFMKSQLIFLELDEFELLGDVVNNIGLLYDDLNMEDLAFDHFFQAMNYYERIGLDLKNGNIWLNIGANYLQKHELDSAFKYLDKSYKLLLAANNKWSLGDYYHEMALLNKEHGDFVSALSYIDSSLFFGKEVNNKRIINSSNLTKAELILSSSPEIAINIIKNILETSQNNLDNKMRYDAYKLLYECYKKNNRIPLALAMHEKYILYYDSVLVTENKLAMVREVLTNQHNKELFKTQLENQNENNQLKIKQTHLIYLALIIVIFIIITIIFLARYRINKHQKQRLMLIEKIEKLKEDSSSSLPIIKTVELNRTRIERNIDRKLNETDWSVLNILLENPVISNKSLAIQANLSIEGISSSLRRMYVEFDINGSKYMKIALILEVVKRSNG